MLTNVQELLDKFNRDRWVETLTDLVVDLGGMMDLEQRSDIQEIIDYLEGKETSDV